MMQAQILSSDSARSSGEQVAEIDTLGSETISNHWNAKLK